MKQIITSFLNDDFYQFTMMQGFWKYEPDAMAEYAFVCRTPNINFSECFDEITHQLKMAANVMITETEINYLASFKYFKPGYLNFLRGFKLNFNDLKIIDVNGHLSIRAKGPLINCIKWEMPVLSIVNEVYFNYEREKQKISEDEVYTMGLESLDSKLKLFDAYKVKFADFGTRRRFSNDWHKSVVEYASKFPSTFTGTSNVDLARRFKVRPIGTMSHGWQQSHLGFTSIDNALPLSMKRWIELYEGAFGTTLTDTFTTKYFFKKFNKSMMRAFEGLRQDSGDPLMWTKQVYDHYMSYGMDPKEVFSEKTGKFLIYSNSLNDVETLRIHKAIPVNHSFGIGTYLTNDVGFNPLNIVYKMTQCNGMPTIKISDDAGKVMCENEDFKKFAIGFFNKGNIT